MPRCAKSQILAQRRAFIFAAEQATAAQFRQHEIDEIAKADRQMRRHDVKAIGGTACEPVLHLVGDLCRRADDLAVTARAGDPEIKLADRQVLAMSEIEQQALAALAGIGFRQRRHWPIDRIGGEIDTARHAAQQSQSDERMDQFLDLLELLFRLIDRSAHDGKDAGHHLQIIRMTAVFAEAALEVGVEATGVLECLMRGEDDLGGARGKQVARDLLERAAAAGDSAATNALGVSYESAGQRATARLWYQQSAARGGKAAARNLARIDASVPEATAERSIERLREDSANGDAEASYELAGRHHRGTGVAVDYGEAVRLYRLAAQQGSLPAQNMLSLILSRSTPAEPVNSAWMLELSHMNLPQGASLVPGATYDDPLDGLVELKPQSLPPSQAAPVIGQRAYLGAPALIGTSVTTPAPAASAPPANNDDPLSHAREMRARSSDGHR